MPKFAFQTSTLNTDMKRLFTAFIIALTGIISTVPATAQFLDTSKPDNFFRLGARIGFNMSNVSVGGKQFEFNHDSWGAGFETGVVADLILREWFAIQPGFFYQSRSNSYTHVSGVGVSQNIRIGHTLYYAFYVPVMFSARFNITDRLRWLAEAGPYLSLGVGHNDNGINISGLEETHFDNDYFDSHKKTSFGIKAGTGLEIYDNYYIGIHYMAGFGNAWKLPQYNGHNKAWTFTLGYNF